MDTEPGTNLFNQDRRKFLRVAVFFPVTFHLLSSSEYEDEQTAIISHPTAERELNISSLIVEEECKDLVPAVVKMWLALDKKLDRIIHTLEQGQKKSPGPDPENGMCTDISITGLQIRFAKELKEGQLIKINILPPTFPPLALTILGKLSWTKETEQSGGKNEYGIAFTAVNEDDRERLVRYIFKRQREIIRSES